MSEGATFSVVPFINRKALGSVAGIVGAGGNAGAVAAGFLFKGALPWPTALADPRRGRDGVARSWRWPSASPRPPRPRPPRVEFAEAERRPAGAAEPARVRRALDHATLTADDTQSIQEVPDPMSEPNGFTDEQKHFLQGFAMGADVARAARGLPVLSGGGLTGRWRDGSGSARRLAADRPTARRARSALHREAQDRVLAAGKTLSQGGAGQARQGRPGPLGRVPRQRRRRRLSQGHGRLPLQVLRPVPRRPGAGRLHVPPAHPGRRAARRGSSAGWPTSPTGSAAATPT